MVERGQVMSGRLADAALPLEQTSQPKMGFGETPGAAPGSSAYATSLAPRSVDSSERACAEFVNQLPPLIRRQRTEKPWTGPAHILPHWPEERSEIGKAPIWSQ